MDVTAFYGAAAPLLAKQEPPPIGWRLMRRLGLFKGEPEMFPDVVGMASNKKLELLRTAVNLLPPDGKECYLEIGTYQGKSLIAAMSGNPTAIGVACDDFSLFEDRADPKNMVALKRNLDRYALSSRVRFFDCDFQDLLKDWQGRGLPPAGVYFYDGAHDEESQFLGISLAESVLADSAIVVVDDWRHAEDSGSFAERGTRRAIAESSGLWSLDHILPARYNGDRDLWWNGVAVLSYQRRGAALGENHVGG